MEVQLRLFSDEECDHGRIRWYDFGRCPDTGYHDAGYVCTICGELPDELPEGDRVARKPAGQQVITKAEKKAG
jgi:hypothetical protein